MTDTAKQRTRVLNPNRCPDGESVDRMATAMERIADSLESLQPAADVVHGLAARLDGLCRFMRRRGPWLLASIPFVLSAVGAITPELADGLKSLIAALLSVPAA
ncbi:MAG: hypothetical protein Q8S03_10140 [Brevundimonas sp.]|uniref:hypothetical protein n=1 Tax=Brevundimonas sp. TaxID=1871086 RepID=UPI0027348CFC|nr:hypothetical protein [Brevundimonas sp.]MDP3405038.1 hypothetical protein [Brevundimonas sp.]